PARTAVPARARRRCTRGRSHGWSRRRHRSAESRAALSPHTSARRAAPYNSGGGMTMATVMIMHWPEVTREQYEEARQKVKWETDVPKGAKFHVSWFGDDGLH